MIDEVEVIKNSKISDHDVIIAKLGRESFKDKEVKKINFCSTAVPEYNLKKASPEDWNAARIEFKNKQFDEDLSVEDLSNKIIETLEEVIVNNFKVSAPPEKRNGKSRNFIPREVRCILRRKLNAGRALKKTTDPELKI